jgi:hypothetical protein
MASVFWDAGGVIYVEFMLHGITINAKIYRATRYDDCVRLFAKRDRTFVARFSFSTAVYPHTAASDARVVAFFHWEL